MNDWLSCHLYTFHLNEMKKAVFCHLYFPFKWLSVVGKKIFAENGFFSKFPDWGFGEAKQQLQPLGLSGYSKVFKARREVAIIFKRGCAKHLCQKVRYHVLSYTENKFNIPRRNHCTYKMVTSAFVRLSARFFFLGTYSF
jgi:hypothetical protein